MKKIVPILLVVLFLMSCTPSAEKIQNTVEPTQTTEQQPTNTPKPREVSNSSSSSSVTVLGTWKDTWGGFNRTLTITKVGDSYKLKEVYSDGSNQTITLGIKVVNGETRLYDTINAYGDYMVIKSDGRLAFYDNQGFIYSIKP